MAIIQIMDFVVQMENLLAGSSIRRKLVKVLNSLSAGTFARRSVLVQLLAINADTALCSRRTPKAVVHLAGDGALNATRTDIHGTLVSGVPVASARGLVR